MLQRLSEILKQPYPFNGEPVRYLKVIALFGLFVAVFLMVFQPFGMHRLEVMTRFLVALSFGAVTFSSLLTGLFATFAFPGWFDEDGWTLGKEMLMGAACFFIVSNANYLFVRYGWYSALMMLDYGGMLIATFAVGFIPYIFILLMDHMRRLKSNFASAQQMSAQMHHPSDRKSENTIVLEGENSTDRLSVSASDILYVGSAGNYVEVIYTNGEGRKKHVLRAPLRKIEDELSAHASFYRSHRTYLVNLNRVARVQGNSQGYRLLFDDGDSIPVARTKNQEFRERMSASNR